MRKPKLTADEGIHRAFVRATQAEGKGASRKMGGRAHSTVWRGWAAVSTPRKAGVALQGNGKSVVDCMSVAVTLAGFVFSALALLHH